MTRKDGPAAVPEEFQTIKDARNGKAFLEKRLLLLVPTGGDITNSNLEHCLHQISAFPGLSKDAVNAIRAVAFILEEMEEVETNRGIREVIATELTELGNDLKLFIDDTTKKIDTHLDRKLAEVDSAIGKITTTAQAAVDDVANKATQDGVTSARPQSYSEALISPPSHVNPRLAAREGIRVRQYMMEGVRKVTALGTKSNQELRTMLNEKIEALGGKGRRVRMVSLQRNGGLLIEMENDAGARWMGNTANTAALCEEMGEGIAMKARTHGLIAYNVPIIFDPDNRNHIEEVCEANCLPKGALAGARWLKPIGRRSPTQRTAYLILTLTDIDTANRAIARGLMFCNRHIRVGKAKKEPIRCLKCQKFGHYARECKAQQDVCSSCAEEGHRSAQCPHPATIRCVSCNSDNHASWSRECPEFLWRADDCDKSNPENMLLFIPSAEPWTWSTARDEVPSWAAYEPAPLPDVQYRQGNQRERKAAYKNPLAHYQHNEEQEGFTQYQHPVGPPFGNNGADYNLEPGEWGRDQDPSWGPSQGRDQNGPLRPNSR